MTYKLKKFSLNINLMAFAGTGAAGKLRSPKMTCFIAGSLLKKRANTCKCNTRQIKAEVNINGSMYNAFIKLWFYR